MATRFYFDSLTAAPVSPSFDAGWNQTGQASRLALRFKNTLILLTNFGGSSFTVPITTTQNILAYQFVSEPLLAQRIDASCLFSLVTSASQGLAAGNCTLAIVAKVVSNDGATARGTVFSTFSVDTAFATTTATRIQTQAAVTALSIQTGDRLVIELGAHAAAPSSATTYGFIIGYTQNEYALTSGVGGNATSWCEFSNDLFKGMTNNFQNIKVGDGMSVSERTRL